MNRDIKHLDSDLNKKLVNEKYNKEGCFYLTIDIIDFHYNGEIVGDAAVGLPAIAKIIGDTLRKDAPNSEMALKEFISLIKKSMKEDE